jgi:hypothetical protein
MARPQKQTVDYFPHKCHDDQIVFILEQSYQAIGYTFWFKLQSLLGRTEGHKIDLSNGNEPTWRYLQALTYTDHDKCKEILNCLAELKAIDRELWQDHKIIWCQNFVDDVIDAYSKRTGEIPHRPSFGEQKPTTDGVSGDGNGESKLNETIVEEIKIEEKESSAADAASSSQKTDKQTFEEYKKQMTFEFQDLDFEEELKKFNLYWHEGKRKLKNPKLALRNWLTNARKYKTEHPGKPKDNRNNVIKDPTVNQKGRFGHLVAQTCDKCGGYHRPIDECDGKRTDDS